MESRILDKQGKSIITMSLQYTFTLNKTQTSPTLHVLLLGNVKDTKATENMTLYLKKKKHLLFERYQDVC